MTPKKSPPATADHKSKGIPYSIIIRGIDRDIIPPEHGDQVDGGNDTMPQTSPEAIGMTFEAFGDNFLVGASWQDQERGKQDEDEQGCIEWD